MAAMVGSDGIAPPLATTLCGQSIVFDEVVLAHWHRRYRFTDRDADLGMHRRQAAELIMD